MTVVVGSETDDCRKSDQELFLAQLAEAYTYNFISWSNAVCLCTCVSNWMLNRAEQITTAAHRDL